MSSWDEIRRLAADLQRVQLGASSKKLSDRNCVEVVAKLIEKSLIDVLFTIDGKEYVTREYFAKQIRDECAGNKGRVSMVELQQTLNVDYPKVEDACNDILKHDNNYMLSMGTLISRDYLDDICCEINNKLQEEGTLNMSNITKMFDLPAELLRSQVNTELGNKIKGFADHENSSILYTTEFVARQAAVVRGFMCGLTKITQIQRILQDLNMSSSIFFLCMDQLKGKLPGAIGGGRHSERAYYTPQIYTKLLSAYVKQQYAQSGIIELSSLRKLGVGDGKEYLNETLSGEKLVSLDTVIISQDSWSQICGSIVEQMSMRHWCNVSECLPEVCCHQRDSIVACEAFIADKQYNTNDWVVADNNRDSHATQVDLCEDACIFDCQLVTDCYSSLEPSIAEKAQSQSANVSSILKDLNRNQNSAPSADSEKGNKKGGKGGKKGGKGKKNKGDRDESNDRTTNVDSDKQALFQFMSNSEIIEKLKERPVFECCPTVILLEIAERIKPKLDAKYKEKVESVLLVVQAGAQSQQKRTFNDFAKTFRELFWDICSFDEGAAIFDELVCIQLRTYLMRSLCTQLVNNCLAYVTAVDNPQQLTTKVINETVDSLSNGKARDGFKALYVTLNSKAETMNEFYDGLQMIADQSVCSLNLKSPDKKTKLELVKGRAAELRGQLGSCEDPAEGLLIITLILMADNISVNVHASGKFVPNLVDKLEKFLEGELHESLVEVQNLVVKSLKKSQCTEEIVQHLKESYLKLKLDICNSKNLSES